MRVYIGNLSIRMKLLVCFFLIATIPTLVIFTNSYCISIDNSEKISLNFSQTAVEQTAKLIENFLDTCENICTYVASDDQISAVLEAADPSVYPATEREINTMLMQLHKNAILQAQCR